MSDTVNTNNASVIPEYKPTVAIIQIVISVVCCGGIIGAIFAIMSLVEGSKVKNFVQAGNIEAANESLIKAKKWNKYSWIAIVICIVLVLLYVFFGGAALISNM